MSKAVTFVQLGRQLADLVEEGTVQLITVHGSGDQYILISARAAATEKTKAQRIIDGFNEVTE